MPRIQFQSGETWNAEQANRLARAAHESTDIDGLGINGGEQSFAPFRRRGRRGEEAVRFFKAKQDAQLGNQPPTVDCHPVSDADGNNENTNVTVTVKLIRNAVTNFGGANEARAVDPIVRNDDVIAARDAEDGSMVAVAYSGDAAVGSMRMVVADPAAQIPPGWAEMDGTANSSPGSGLDYTSTVSANGETVGRFLMLRSTTGTGGNTSHSHGAGTLSVDSHDHGAGTLAVDSHDHDLPDISHQNKSIGSGKDTVTPAVKHPQGKHTGITTKKTAPAISGSTGKSSPGLSGSTESAYHVPRWGAAIPIERIS